MNHYEENMSKYILTAKIKYIHNELNKREIKY